LSSNPLSPSSLLLPPPFPSAFPAFYLVPFPVLASPRLSANPQRHWTINHTGAVTFPPSTSGLPASSAAGLDEDIDAIPPNMMGVGGIGALYSVGGEKILRIGLGYAGELERVV